MGYRYDPVGGIQRQYDEASGLQVDLVDKEKRSLGLLTVEAISATRTASATGATTSFSVGTRTRLYCTAAQASGTVAQAVIDLRSEAGVVLGTFYYPQGSGRWIDIPGGTGSAYFHVVTLTGSSTPTLTLTVAG